MKKVLITLKGSVFFGQVGEVVEETPTLYSVHVEESQYMIYDFLKSECEILLPLSEIVKAWEEGKEIEIWDTNQAEAHWSCLSVAVFFTSPYYRIKPDPKEQIVPYTWDDRDFLRGLWVKGKESGAEMQINYISKSRIGGQQTHSYEWFHHYYTHLDGSPLGKKI